MSSPDSALQKFDIRVVQKRPTLSHRPQRSAGIGSAGTLGTRRPKSGHTPDTIGILQELVTSGDTLSAALPERVLIFGATSAIAQEIGRVYARRGARLFLVGRSPQKLAAAAAALTAAAPGAGPEKHGNGGVDSSRAVGSIGAIGAVGSSGDLDSSGAVGSRNVVVGTHAADLNETALASTLVSSAVAALGGLDVAVIAQGLLGAQQATERDFHQAEEVIATNFTSVVALLIPLANHFETMGTGHLVVLSSVAGERGRPRNYTYGSAKGALNVYLQGVRSRLGPRGVGVHTIKLGPVDTPMTSDHKKTLLFAKAPAVAAAIVRAVDAGRDEPFVPWFWSGIMMIVRAMPELVFRRIRALSGR